MNNELARTQKIEINTQELIDQLKRAILVAQRYIEKLEDHDDGSLFAAERDWLITTSDIADLQADLRMMIRAQLYTKKNREE
jgi:hypothetical protein